MSAGAAGSPHRPALEQLGLPEPAVAALARYLDLLADWGRRVNLTGARTPAGRVARLVEDVLPALPLVRAGRLVDLGSGNGSPGLVLALLRPELKTTLIEPRLRRWAFLREAVREAGRPDVAVERARHDGYTGAPARTLTLRALALPLADLAGLVEPGGSLLVFGGRPQAQAPFALEQVSALPRGRLFAFRRVT